ncbi:zinc-binding dehydrogenase [Acinetobacter sp. GXMZU3951]
MRNQAFRLAKYPQGTLSIDMFDLLPFPLPQLTQGEFLVKQSYMSLEPALQSWQHKTLHNPSSHSVFDDVLQAYGVGMVIQSLNAQFPVGAMVVGPTTWSEYVLGCEEMQIVDSTLPAEAVLAIFYLTGLTAYAGLIKIGHAQSGETVLISDASSSVGALLGQLAKAQGLKVLGIAESAGQCAWLKQQLGFDAALNENAPDLATELKAAAPHGIDLFYPNTQRSSFDQVMHHMNQYARIVWGTTHAVQTQHQPKHAIDWADIQRKSLHLQGFVVADYLDYQEEANHVIAALLQQGLIQYKVHVIDDLAHLPQRLIEYFNHDHVGQLMVKF